MPSTEKWDASNWNLSYIPKVAAILEATPSNAQDFKTFGGDDRPSTTLRNGDPNDPTLTVWDAEITYLMSAEGYTPYGVDVDVFMPTLPAGPQGGPPPPSPECDNLYTYAIIQLNFYEISGDRYYLVEHDNLLQQYYDCIGGSSPTTGGGSSCTQPCERDCETQDEHLASFKINGWGVFTNIRRNWFEDYFVFHADILGLERTSLGTSQGFSTKMVTTSFTKGDLLDCTGVCNGKWKTVNHRIRPDWDLAKFADSYKIVWSEVDDGSTTTGFSIPFTANFKLTIPGLGEVSRTVGLTFSYSKTIGPIVELGSQNVFYCDQIQRDNNTGSVSFRCD